MPSIRAVHDHVRQDGALEQWAELVDRVFSTISSTKGAKLLHSGPGRHIRGTRNKRQEMLKRLLLTLPARPTRRSPARNLHSAALRILRVKSNSAFFQVSSVAASSNAASKSSHGM